MVHCANRRRTTVDVLKASTPCATHHFRGGDHAAHRCPSTHPTACEDPGMELQVFDRIKHQPFDLWLSLPDEKALTAWSEVSAIQGLLIVGFLLLLLVFVFVFVIDFFPVVVAIIVV